MDNQRIIRDIEAYLAKAKIKESTLGRKALNDGKAIARLRAGKRMWPETVQKLREFIAKDPPPRRRSVAPETIRAGIG